MIIHIGNNKYLYKDEIIAILDRKSAEATIKSASFINELIKDNSIIGSIDQHTKTYIITTKNNKIMLYTSNISSKALVNRNI